jgi:hypothetical protein
MYGLKPFFLHTLMLALFGGPAMATDSRRHDMPREGTVVYTTAHDLVMRARPWDVQVGTTYRYRLAPNALVTCDGMLCNLQDLKPGQRVRVTALAEGEWFLATRVEALDEQSAFPVAIATIMPGRTTGQFAIALPELVRSVSSVSEQTGHSWTQRVCVFAHHR